MWPDAWLAGTWWHAAWQEIWVVLHKNERIKCGRFVLAIIMITLANHTLNAPLPVASRSYFLFPIMVIASTIIPTIAATMINTPNALVIIWRVPRKRASTGNRSSRSRDRLESIGDDLRPLGIVWGRRRHCKRCTFMWEIYTGNDQGRSSNPP